MNNDILYAEIGEILRESGLIYVPLFLNYYKGYTKKPHEKML